MRKSYFTQLDNGAAVWEAYSKRGIAVIASQAKVNDAIRSPCAGKCGATDKMRSLADILDQGLAARNLKIDNTALVVGWVTPSK